MEFNTNTVIIYSSLVILVILVIYLLVRQKERQTSENFDVSNHTVDAINNLGLIVNNIRTSDKLSIPSNNTSFLGSVSIRGKLTADALSQDTINLILPKGMIVSYNNTIAPLGWALCDGSIVNGKATPDLRGKFIIGNITEPDTNNNYILGYSVTPPNPITNVSQNLYYYVLVYIIKL